jgi:hypothetical protein
VARSFGRKYVEFDTPSSPIKLALYGRRALAQDAGVAPDGTGSHRLVLESDASPVHGPRRVRVRGRNALAPELAGRPGRPPLRRPGRAGGGRRTG